ncbi:MAG: hypothetical protein EPO22_03185 [Dehalococcoidia bacterium]|nr:MAG: hypothetical protein EPO22_03185 [Dehalococcoidia bacterium]
MIIWGWRSKGEPEWSGIIECPQCSKWRLHYGVRVKRWFTLFFIPVFPLWGDSKVLCAVCLREEKLSSEAYAAVAQAAISNLKLADAGRRPELADQLLLDQNTEAG